jgi:uncharacterized membrane protein YjjP (DUF1212 family)
MQKIDYVLDFAVHLGREMLECGANLERVNLTMEIICKTYQLREVTIFALSSYLSVSAKELGGETCIRQTSIPVNGLHLEKLKKLNNLSYKVQSEKPAPEKLEDMLFETLMTPTYPTYINLIGYLIAMMSLCRIFGGTITDILIASINTVIIFFISNIFIREKLNRIITNIVTMFICGCIAIFFTSINFSQNVSVIIITNAFYLIPGIPMVNAVRNIICGNEMNGILELLKVFLEVGTIVAGLYIAFFCFGSWDMFF